MIIEAPLTLTGTALVVADITLGSGGGSGASTFLALTDTPSTYSGQGGKVAAVNAGGTALEFISVGGTGTVTSVAVTGTDGLEVDSGSPITAAGTITLGVNAATLKTHLALGNVTNTSDANKPVSTAQQTALDLKANLVSPSFTTPALGTPTAGNFSSGTFTWPTFNQSTTGNAATVTTINGRISAGSNVTLSGTGTGGDPYVISSTAAGGGGGTVTTVSVATANGVSGSVANATTTPAITLALGAITPSSVAASGTVTGSNLSGTNNGDQTTIVGITGTMAQFDAACSDGNFLYVGDVTSNATHTGDVTGSGALTIANDTVTYAKMQNVSAASRLVGRGSAGGSGDPEEITIGSGLSLSGTTLSATATSNATHTGDATGSTVLTLATVNADVGTFGSGTDVPVITVNGKGLITALSTAPVSIGIGQVSGLGTGIDTFLATPTSANLRAALTDETGTGAAYFAGGALGTPSSGTISTGVVIPWEIQIACSDETTALTTGTAKATFRMPWAATLASVIATVTTAPTGSTIIVDINESGSTLMTTTKLSIDATEKTSTTAASAAALTDTSLANDAEITIDIDQIGSTVAGAGLKVTLKGTRTI